MPRFVLNTNAQSNGDNEVHNSDDPCGFLQYVLNPVDLGWHPSCHGAVSHAKRIGYPRANGCAYCAGECHTG